MRLTREGTVLAALLTLFLCRAVIAGTIVPPWQGPDEPGHFARTYGLAFPSTLQVLVDQSVLQSMVRHRWWALYDDPPPERLRSFDDVYGVGGGELAQPLYYGLAASVLKLTRPSDIDAAYGHLRVLSVLLSIVALGLGWVGTRVLFGSEVALGASVIAVLHPQFLLASISVNPDALVNVCGAFVWWQAARAVMGHRRGFSVALMLVGAAATLFTKRIGLVMVGVAVLIVLALVMAGPLRRLTRRDAVLGAVVAVTGIALLVTAGLLFEGQVNTWKLMLVDAFTIRRPMDAALMAEALRFARMTVDYFWLIAGWLRFQPPESWLWVARVLIVGGFAGAAVVLFESRRENPSVALAWLFVVAQLTAMLVVTFWMIPSAPQARYLFPVFAPITALLFVGLRRIVPLRLQPRWVGILVLVLALLDVTGFTTVHIPTYIP